MSIPLSSLLHSKPFWQFRLCSVADFANLGVGDRGVRSFQGLDQEYRS
jgi:hypothetical protein